MDSSKYHYLAVKKPNTLLQNTILSKHNENIISLNCFGNFHACKNLDQCGKSFRDHNHAELELSQKFKTILNKETNDIEKVAGNI